LLGEHSERSGGHQNDENADTETRLLHRKPPIRDWIHHADDQTGFLRRFNVLLYHKLRGHFNRNGVSSLFFSRSISGGKAPLGGGAIPKTFTENAIDSPRVSR
jgi:hypothetical protein